MTASCDSADSVEVVARVLLSDQQALSRNSLAKQLPRVKGSPHPVGRTPRLFASNWVSATVWNDGQAVTASEFHQRDRSRVVFAVTALESDAHAEASDFVIQ